MEQKVLLGTGWNLIFCVPGLTQGWETHSESKISYFCFWYKSRERRVFCVVQGMESFSLDVLGAVKKMCFESMMCGCVEFVVAGWPQVKKSFWLSNLKLEQSMSNLFVVISKCCLWWFDRTGGGLGGWWWGGGGEVKIKKIGYWGLGSFGLVLGNWESFRYHCWIFGTILWVELMYAYKKGGEILGWSILMSTGSNEVKVWWLGVHSCLWNVVTGWYFLVLSV